MKHAAWLRSAASDFFEIWGDIFVRFVVWDKGHCAAAFSEGQEARGSTRASSSPLGVQEGSGTCIVDNTAFGIQ